MCKFFVIGISDEAVPVLTGEVQQVIADSRVFSGGARHRELVKDLLPKNHRWIDVEVPLKTTFDIYRELNDSVVLFASGDPLFFGIGNTLKREFPEADLKVYPFFNSLQMLAHHCHLPYGLMKVATLTGRPWENLDQELIRGTGLIGVLTDKKKTPAVIGQRMLEVGLVNYTVYLGERMGGERQQVRQLTVEELSRADALAPNCLILEKTSHFERTLGIPENEFHYLDGRPRMITKRSIRLMSLAMLKLDTAQVMWDVGFCTGSVSIEAKQAAPHLELFAIEKRNESAELMLDNRKKFRIPGIQFCIGDFFEADLSGWTNPDRIFIGGHGGRLQEMLTILVDRLNEGGYVVFNAVSEKTAEAFQEAVEVLSLTITDQLTLQQDDHNPVTIFQAQKISQECVVRRL